MTGTSSGDIATIKYVQDSNPTPTPTPTPPPCPPGSSLLTILDQKFDNIAPPALPAGWTATNGTDPDGVFWQTSNTGLPSPPADSPPNAAWVNGPPVVSDKYLDSPGISATESNFVRLTFRHNFNLESGLDGGVLEIKNFSGQFVDILAAGGSFSTGGYNATIATGTGNPIAGRQAWTGNSGGFITTIVNLPPELLNAVLRWRMANDNSGSSEGWRVDTINVVWCHFSGTPTPTPTPSITPSPSPTPSVTPTPTPAPTPSPCPFCWQPVTLSQNFDSVTPPALPQDWTATNVQGPTPLWVTSNSGVPSPPAESKPNAAFVDDPSVISDKVLDSLSFSVFEGISPQLTFRHNFNLEASGMNPVLGFDGGVLEISLDNGQTYQDVLQMGGNFVTGGYNRTISTERGSPVAGRQAWSGNSGGFMTTTVNLPPIIDHATLRWRMASDNSGSGEGWRIDNVKITWCQGPPCSPTPPPPTPTPTASVTPTPSAPPTPTATPTPTTFGNISTRLRVETGDNVLIGGFIITGPSGFTKTVVIRGIGPSLNVNGVPVPARLTDPLIELHKPDGSIVANDNWREATNAGSIPLNLQPGDDRESAIMTTLAPGAYTAIVRGAHGETGVGLIEAYDLEQGSPMKMANISTRGFVQTDDNVMIGGFIITGPSGSTTRVVMRGLGPSLNVNGVPVPGKLTDPLIELHASDGTVVTNDNWRDAANAGVIPVNLQPSDDREAAILATLAPGGYTVIVKGAHGETGVALVEAYQLDN